MPLKVGFYSDALTTGSQYGLSRYAWELFRSLQEQAPDISVRPLSAHKALPPAELENLRQEHNYQALPWARRWTAAAWTLTGFPRLEQWAPWIEVLHCVELDYIVPTRRPWVVTIHDIGPLTHPEFFSASHPWLLEAALKNAARRADTIICVSQATADEVEGFLGEALGDRMVVIPEGVSFEFHQPVDRTEMTQTSELLAEGWPFFLWAGSLNPRKNLRAVVGAFEQVAASLPHHLILAGGQGWDSSPILQAVTESSVRQRIHLPGRVSDTELRGLYQRADAFLYPSLMEGFGLPILEAMASNCPVITSNCSSMAEVAGDATFLIDPRDVSDLAAAMHCLGTDQTFSTHLRWKGRARSEDFRWDTCAAEVARVYERLGQSAGQLPRALRPSAMKAHHERSKREQHLT